MPFIRLFLYAKLESIFVNSMEFPSNSAMDVKIAVAHGGVHVAPSHRWLATRGIMMHMLVFAAMKLGCLPMHLPLFRVCKYS